jgi:hypothetical protein
VLTTSARAHRLGDLDRRRVEHAAKHVRGVGVAVAARRGERDGQLFIALPAADLVRDPGDRAVALDVPLAGLLLLRVLEQVALVRDALVGHGRRTVEHMRTRKAPALVGP